MFKSLFIVLALVSTPAPVYASEVVEQTSESNELATDANVRVDFGFGFGYRPYRNHYRPYRPYRPHYRPTTVTCKAENGRGVPFYATAWDEGAASFDALEECRHSRDTYRPRSCYVVNCFNNY